jgi:hypothetical protein
LSRARPRNGTAIAAALVAVALAATACSSGSKNAKGKATTTVTRYPPTVPVSVQTISEGSGACGVLNESEVAAAVGSAVNPGSGQQTKSGESCRWTFKASGSQLVAVIISPSGKKEYDSAKSTLGSAAKDLPGVGDQAFVANDTAYVMKGPRLLIVEVATSQPIATRTQEATKLATSAAGRF